MRLIVKNELIKTEQSMSEVKAIAAIELALPYFREINKEVRLD